MAGSWSDSDEDAVTADKSGEILFEVLTGLKHNGKLSAKDVCIIGWWAAQAGAVGPVRALAKAPGDPSSGHYSMHFDSVCGTVKDNPKHYSLQVPMFDRAEGLRKEQSLACLPPHEALVDELEGEEAWQQKLLHYVDTSPPAYRQHLVVARSLPSLAIPVSLYMDGVQYTSQGGSVLGFFLVNEITDQRHLLCCLRKFEMCRCGCGGWCSLWPVFAFIHWSLRSLSLGVFPHQRHNGQPFSDSEGRRARAASQPLGVVAACLYIKADLAEFAHTLGLPSTAANQHPCFLCRCQRPEYVRFVGWDVLAMPWPAKSFEDYKADCAKCELWRTVSLADRAALCRLLAYDKRRTTGASRGLALTSDYAPLGLLKGDRLEPCLERPDVATFFLPDGFPGRVLFWRVSEESSTHHRNPLFSEETGITLQACAALDWLHCLSLGVFQTYISFAMQHMFRADAWRTGETTAPTIIAQSMARVAAEMSAWIKEPPQANRGLHVIETLRQETFGTWTQPRCLLKGGETNTFLEFFVLAQLRLFGGALGELLAPIRRARDDLWQLLQLIRAHKTVFTLQALQQFHEHTRSYLQTMHGLDLAFKPKDHMLMHMANRIRLQGSPSVYGNWKDESINRTLKNVAAAAHGSVAHKRILNEFPLALEATRAQQRRRT